ncbi:nicotinate phosphoribosyltransferase [Formicincola oecophyllae]|uniref:Nicotinate phosphoribosyltransferase n=1 Tax=Formicincola oecophyllae TaxID=2558361 RepID=A0A4Y6UBX9_9PROT|nr:nicotinate phosphoribosyltransferase [Formicincola oecophyllae]
MLDLTDAYFIRTREIVERFGDCDVTYAVFLRRPVVAACGLAHRWLEAVSRRQGFQVEVRDLYSEGAWVGAGEPLFYLKGRFSKLAPLETLLLQKIGPTCVAAHNAYQMAMALPHVPFLAMDARHCTGAAMQEQMAYAAAVGSRAAQREGAKGFIGNANDQTAPFFGLNQGLGTMPHALVGYAGSTLRAAEMFVERFPDQPLTILVDYFGQEATDALAVCNRFADKARAGQISVRLDTHGSRYFEGLDPQTSYEVLERHVPGTLRRYRSEKELRYLVGAGVSAAAIWRLREVLDEAGFGAVKIVASSGFSVAKCVVMNDAKAPLDVVGTGSFLPETWGETYATADVVAYDGRPLVKKGREFLLNKLSAAR